jgi:hypothetical protein
VRPGDEQVRADDRADPRLIEQRGRECAYVGEDLPFELGRFAGCGIDPATEASQDEPRRELVGSCAARAAQAAAALEQPSGWEHAQLLAEPVRGGDDHAAKLSECFAAHVDGAAACDQQEPQRFASVAVTWQRERLAGKRCACRPRRVECVVFAAQASLGPRGTADFEHALSTASEVTRKPRAVASRALDRPDASTVGGLAREAQRRLIATPLCLYHLPRQHSPRWCGNDRQDVLVPVRVDTDDVVQLICKHLDRSSGFCS